MLVVLLYLSCLKYVYVSCGDGFATVVVASGGEDEDACASVWNRKMKMELFAFLVLQLALCSRLSRKGLRISTRI